MHSGAELIALHKNRFWQTEQGLKADIGFLSPALNMCAAIDVSGAQAMVIQGCLVKTGKYRQVYCDQSSVKPDFVLDSIADVID